MYVRVISTAIFAKGKRLKPVGIDMPRDKYKGLHGDLGHVEQKISLKFIQLIAIFGSEQQAQT
jgi:hypothetical protein